MAAIGRLSLPDLGPMQPPRLDQTSITKPSSSARRIQIRVKDPLDHSAPAILHEPRSYSPEEANSSAVIMVSGGGGGGSGPAGIYPSLADRLPLFLRIPCIRLDYLLAADTPHCTSDIIACLNYLTQHFCSKSFVPVGWSFGGTPCFCAAADEPVRIRGVATIASQMASQGVSVAMLSPRPLLLLHGTEDTVLEPVCSETLFRQYGGSEANGGSCELRLLEGGNHGLTDHAPEVEGILLAFVTRVLGFESLLGSGSGHKNIRMQDLVGRDLM